VGEKNIKIFGKGFVIKILYPLFHHEGTPPGREIRQQKRDRGDRTCSSRRKKAISTQPFFRVIIPHGSIFLQLIFFRSIYEKGMIYHPKAK
jgi:hypothetical protein